MQEWGETEFRVTQTTDELTVPAHNILLVWKNEENGEGKSDLLKENLFQNSSGHHKFHNYPGI
jgi:hypothetical protein